MATWASYSADQQAQVQDVVNNERSLSSLMSQVAILSAAIGAAWNGGTSTLVQNLGAGETIPNSSGYAGAQGVQPADVTNFAGYAITFSDPTKSPNGNDGTGGGYNSAFIQALRVKLAGINASITH